MISPNTIQKTNKSGSGSPLRESYQYYGKKGPDYKRDSNLYPIKSGSGSKNSSPKSNKLNQSKGMMAIQSVDEPQKQLIR